MTKFSPSGMMDPAIPVPAEPEGFLFNIGQVGPGILMVLTRTWEILPNFSNGNVIQLRENNIRNEYAMKILYTAFFVVTISCFCKGTHQKHGLFDKKEI